ncbi:MFS transporter [Microbacterium indicum]|uniref:MFS transporter n=1 Tax=Microbacterium indicum TaxID=358100 RepID=UPI00041A0C9A|nr:MFS transporter [Microbacterium indicum]
MSEPLTQPSASDPNEPMTQPVASVRAPSKYFVGLTIGYLGLYFALMTPVLVSMQIKAQTISDDPAALLQPVLSIGALGALIANPLAGALSDRTRTRWGRRRPWLLSGVIVFLGGLAWVAFSEDQTSLIFAWLLCQLAANTTLASLVASFADNVPQFQRGLGSSLIAVAQNVAILGGTYLTVFFVGNMPVLFILPGIIAVIAIVIYTFTCKDELPTYKLKPFTWLNLISSFWTNPIKNPDFGLAWWSRFAIILATFMFTTYRLLYMQDHIGLSLQDATAAVALGVLYYTIALLVGTAIAGRLSDRLGRRKIFVGGSTALFGVGLVILAHADDVAHFYIAEVVMGLAYGIYLAVDQALVIDVLPNADLPGKDLGVINIANALPQSIAPAIGPLFLGIGVSDNSNYTALLWAAGVVCVLGALAVIPIKKVK